MKEFEKDIGNKCKHYKNVEEGFYCWKCIEKLINKRFIQKDKDDTKRD